MNKIKAIVTDPALHKYGLPKRETPGSAGLDLRAMIGSPSLTIVPGGVVVISTGLRIWVEDPSYVAFAVPRSGLGNRGLVLGNLIGTIDADYQGDLKLSLWNRSQQAITITRGERVAQLLVVPIATPELEIVDDFEAVTERGANGFGSTGAA